MGAECKIQGGLQFFLRSILHLLGSESWGFLKFHVFGPPSPQQAWQFAFVECSKRDECGQSLFLQHLLRLCDLASPKVNTCFTNKLIYQDCRIHSQYTKSTVDLKSGNTHLENAIFWNAIYSGTKNGKYIEQELTKCQELDTENSKALLQEIKEGLERYTMFMDWKIPYCQDDYSAQIELRFNAIPIKSLARLSHKNV